MSEMVTEKDRQIAKTSMFVLVFAFIVGMLFMPWSQAAADSSSGSLDEADSASSHTEPVALHSAKPTISIERGEGEHVVMRVTSQVTLEGTRSLDAHFASMIVLVDSRGKPLHKELRAFQATIAPDSPQAIEAVFTLTSGEQGRMKGVYYACLSFSELGLLRISPNLERYSLEGAKRAFAQAEEERKQREHVEQWRARFPLDDYSNTILIGDSIMQNTSSELSAALPGVTIDADAGRTLEKGGYVFEHESPDAGVLDHVRNDRGGFERYVIQTGNNDVSGMSKANAEEIVSRLGPEKEIYFVTMISTGNSAGTRNTNEAIEAVVQDNPNVHAIDWFGLVQGHESDYLSDYCHPRTDRYREYANFIKEGLDTVY